MRELPVSVVARFKAAGEQDESQVGRTIIRVPNPPCEMRVWHPISTAHAELAGMDNHMLYNAKTASMTFMNSLMRLLFRSSASTLQF